MCTCMYGEKLDIYLTSKAYYCLECLKNTYLFQSSEIISVNLQCKKCPEEFICLGKYADLKIKPGYWSHTNL